MKALILSEWDLRPHRGKFMDNVLVRGPDECWPWCMARRNTPLSSKYPAGGVFAVCLAGQRRATSLVAHRVALFYFTGYVVGPDEVVRHTCNNHMCCNPAHLKVETVNYAEAEA